MKPSTAKIKCSLSDYLAYPAASSSGLRTIIEQSPAHYLWNLEHPTAPTPAQAFGSAIHEAILEPKLFKERAIIIPEFSGKGSMAEREKWHIAHEGMTKLTADQMETIQGILNSLINHERARQLIADGRAEESLFWTCPETGLKMKSRPDFWREGHIVVSVKSTLDASYRAFQKDFANYNYHVQAAMELEACTAVLGGHYDKHITIAVEKNGPYAVNCFQADEQMLEEGRQLYFRAARILKECQERNHYPAYPADLLPLTLPTWAVTHE